MNVNICRFPKNPEDILDFPGAVFVPQPEGLSVDDSFPKIIVRHDIRKRWYDEGIGIIGFLLYATDTVQNWTDLDKFYTIKDGSNVSDSCKYFFKACYADAMTIVFLNLLPRDYFVLFLDELPTKRQTMLSMVISSPLFSGLLWC